ncbi:3-deoxy-D-manno-octulosonate 8-phosphate phosphatase (KDO 8-P phosphatase) [Thorsellia anophelis DSM 18579]|uniref:3-deoxy-D-manno-octulosonate 8-phosphate phosphatase KdsC n=1 Tax=Thorsellia anophelis DSM 18579 TaxID=1123402 RepID=A0A1I0A9B2_9GAMM|nr:3-deoxy-D-manno-octulosonate 8-phosphate phosphatase (KDO 8-P phosphatase) [Thorsellia anophelis DSM 18579]
MSYIDDFKKLDSTLIQKAKRIKLVICDVDGVLTDGLIYMGNAGEELKAFHVRDGFGIHALLQIGIETALITGRQSKLVEHRAATLKIKHIYQGQSNKLIAFEDLCKQTQLSHDSIAYIGDDLIDAPVMDKVGLSIAVKDAHPMLITHSHYQTQLEGGKGAVREVCDLILFAKDHLHFASGLSV